MKYLILLLFLFFYSCSPGKDGFTYQKKCEYSIHEFHQYIESSFQDLDLEKSKNIIQNISCEDQNSLFLKDTNSIEIIAYYKGDHFYKNQEHIRFPFILFKSNQHFYVVCLNSTIIGLSQHFHEKNVLIWETSTCKHDEKWCSCTALEEKGKTPLFYGPYYLK